MPLEQEVMGLLIGGVSIVMGIAILATVFLWMENKNQRTGYIWTLFHLLLISVAAYFVLKGIAFDYNHPMASEEISLQIGISGVIWAFSMICLVIALFSFSKERKHNGY
ncbi:MULTISPECIES: hypothetical protein [unclassified Mesobacillus]|uniref:hypothetical protein n=1 Tax=unclassified Mesobacillus TaxID=2675270 RepID=UPI00204021AE|nr:MULTISPECIES: hypothetical protein [unclassified Mesobacillus]MCM3124483.1 hypothetical protein [Mesobacillus sp. MER 33]MCM3234807.1 hypothetical protein [Mesobacillus sp. MER 48]